MVAVRKKFKHASMTFGKFLRRRGFVLVGLAAFVAFPAFIDFYPSTSKTAEGSPARVDRVEALTTAIDEASWREIPQPSRPPAEIEWEFSRELAATDPEESTEFDCMIEPWEEVSIRSTIVGRIDAIHVERADFVQKGDLILELDVELANAALEVAASRAGMTASIHSLEARRSLGVKRGDRAVELYSQNALALDAKDEILTEKEISEYDLQNARDQHTLAVLELAREQARFEQRRIRSPVTGIVADRLMSVGEVVDEEIVFEIAQIDPLRVEVILPAIEFGTIRRGMKAAVIPEIPGDEVLVATIRLVDGIIDSASGTFGVELELPNLSHAIPGGQRCRVRFMDASPEDEELARVEPIEP